MFTVLTAIERIGSQSITEGNALSTFKERSVRIAGAHVVSVEEDLELTRTFKNPVCRVETLRGSYNIVGSSDELDSLFFGSKRSVSKKILKD